MFKPADLLSLYFIALLGIVTILFIPSIELWSKLLITYFLLAVVIVSTAMYGATSRAGKRSSYLSPALYVVIILVIFNSLGDIIPSVRQRTFDDILIRIDFVLFGVHPTVWMEKMINPTLTALFQIAYSSYYFIPLSLGAVLIVKERDRELDECLFGIVLCFYLSYVGYLLMPAIGPRFTLDHLQTSGLDAGPVTQTIRNILNRLEHNKTDAFPSGHTAVALLALFYAFKYKETILFRILLPMVAALIYSTVYLRYHYVIDVFAGVMLTALTILISPRAYRFLSPGPPKS